MDDIEARVRCLELAQKLSPIERDSAAIVQIATALYDFAKAPPSQTPATVHEDKPRRGRPPKVDPLS